MGEEIRVIFINQKDNQYFMLRGINKSGVENNLFILVLIIICVAFIFSIFSQSPIETVTSYDVYEEDTPEKSSLLIPLLILVVIASLVFGITKYYKKR